MKKLYLVDVSSMFFRAFYAIPPLKTSQGLPTNALYGLLAMTIKLLRETKPDYMVFCYDRKEPSFRSEIYEDYKANRSEMPEDLQPQIPYIKKLVDLLGIASLEMVGYEADDIIGTLAEKASKEDIEVFIVSGDKDFAQLVNNKICIYDTMKNIRYDEAKVVEKWGVPPRQFIDYLSIVGDSSDNIPGVKGVGPKGAQKLLSEFQTLDGIYENIDNISGENLRLKMKEGQKNAYLAKKLVSIVKNVPLDFSWEKSQLKPIHKEQLKTLLDELEFGAFLRKIFGSNDATGEVAQAVQVGTDSVSLGRSQWSLSELQEKIQPYEDVWISKNERGLCLGRGGEAIQVNATLSEIGLILSQKKIAWHGFDLKSIWHDLKVPEASAPTWDTMLAAYVIKAGETSEFAEVYETYTGKKIPELGGPEENLQCEQELFKILQQRLIQTNGESVLKKFELPLVPVLYDMEVQGIYIDKGELAEQSRTLATDIQRLEKTIFKLADESFNIASPKQLSQILYEKLKIPATKKTKTGYSTDSDVLSKLAGSFPICQEIISYRELTKLKSTYVDALPLLIDPQDGRLHTHFHQALTQTGRLSSSNPNLQNIPIRTERGRLIRKAFRAKPGQFLLSVDYSQIELRILAEITGDPGLTSAFKNNLDIHLATASEVFGVPLDQVSADQRRMAKAVNFGIAYGQGVYGLSESLDIPRGEAKTIIENYFNKFKKVKDYMMDTVQLAKDKGYAETIFGRRRYIDEFKSSSDSVRKFGERAAINAPIQGAASDLMKKAMIEIANGSSLKMILQVHDELLFECPKDSVESAATEAKEIMENVAQFSVPLKVNVAWGENWDDAHA